MIRRILISGLPIWAFLAAYVVLTIVGNALYLMPHGSLLVTLSGDGAPIHAGRDVGFWTLLLLPIVLIPLANWVGRVAGPAAEAVAPLIPEIPRTVYVLLSVSLYTYVVISLGHADALLKFVSGTNATDAVRNRLALLDALGFKPQM